MLTGDLAHLYFGDSDLVPFGFTRSEREVSQCATGGHRANANLLCVECGVSKPAVP